MGIDLLAINDTNLVRETGRTIMVETLSGEVVEYDVYQVNIDLLYYNPNCYEIAPCVAHYDYVNGQGALKELSKDADNREEYNVIVDNFIEKIPAIHLYGQDDVYLSYPSMECGVILKDGKVINGNDIFAMLRNEKTYVSKKLFFETIIYDEYEEIDEETTAYLKTYKFLAAEYMDDDKIDYDHEIDFYKIKKSFKLLDISIGIRNDIANERVDIEGFPISTVEEYLKIAEVYGEFLKYIKLPEQYAFIRKQNNKREIEKTINRIVDLDIPKKEQLKIAFFNNLLWNVDVSWNVMFDVFSDNKYEELCEKQIKLYRGIETQLVNADISSENDLCEFLEKNSKLKTDIEASWNQICEIRKKNNKIEALVNDHSITELELSIRSLNCLRRSGIATIRELMEYDEEKLKTVMNLGAKGIKEVTWVIDELKKLDEDISKQS